MVACRTPERQVRGSINFTYDSIDNTQEAVAPSRHERIRFDWDVKPRTNQIMILAVRIIYTIYVLKS